MSFVNSLRYISPPPGTSAYQTIRNKGTLAQAVANYTLNAGLRSGIVGVAKSVHSPVKSVSRSISRVAPPPTADAPPPTVDSPAVSSSQPQTFDYLDAPWASAYQMSRETAYSEALNNTAYQRSVKDMQKAGLNPAVIFGAGNGYTAGVPAYVSSGTSPSVSSGSSRSGSSGSGRSKSSGKLFSSSAYSVMSALGGIVGALATKSAGGYWIGTSLTQGAMSALSLLSNGVKKR